MPSQGELLELLEPYLESRRVHLVSSGLAQESRYLRRFFAFLKAQGVHEVEAICESHIVGYRRELGQLFNRRGEPISDSFLQQAILVVRTFLSWAHKKGLLLWSFSDLPIPKRVDKIRYVPTSEEMQQLLEQPNLGTIVGLRDRLILELLYVLGLRSGECIALDLNHADLSAQTLTVVGKGGHQRLLPLSPKLFEFLLRYLEEARPRLSRSDDEPAIFLNRTGRRLGRHSVLLRVRLYGSRLGLLLIPHQLRHACATHLLEGGAKLPYIARLLGHQGLSSTMRYARVRLFELKREHRRCHPRAIGDCLD